MSNKVCMSAVLHAVKSNNEKAMSHAAECGLTDKVSRLQAVNLTLDQSIAIVEELVARSKDALQWMNIAIEFNGQIRNTRAMQADRDALAAILARVGDAS